MTRPREPWTVRVAVWSARHRWPIVALWFVLTIGAFGASIAAGGTRSADAVATESREDETYESARAFEVFGASGVATETHQFVLLVNDPSRTLDDPAFAATLDGVLERMSALTAPVDGVIAPVFANAIDPRLAPPEAALVSADRTTVRIRAEVPGEQPAVDQRLDRVRTFLDELRAAHPGLRIHSLDGRLANQDIEQLVNGELDASLRLTIPLTFLILVIAFGAAVAAFVPLVLAVTSLLAAFGVLGLYSQLIDPVSPYASQLIVLIGL
ncbi:MAG TPA: MMPL family transporter, partial [Candidatus Limnocylindrales bacterium]|nr:MMPL family transporter [Candidatus Limnocylindrales bacterium]